MSPEHIIWHSSASAWGTADTIRSWHQDRGWSTIGYHGVILNGFNTAEDERENRRLDWLDGSFQIGRTWDADSDLEGGERGAHAYGFNARSVGLCLIGRDGNYTERQLVGALEVTWEWMHLFSVRVSNVIGHYELGLFDERFKTDKTCPDLDMNFVRDCLQARQDLYRHAGVM